MVDRRQALIVHESMFGNTARIAEAVADGLSELLDVVVADVADWPQESDRLGLLVVGGPTHAFGLSRRSTRAEASRRASFQGRPERGLREWLDEIPRHHWPVPFAAFDTRIRHPRLPGSAAKGAARRLRRFGFDLVVPPESFWVQNVSGPLLGGELERARTWGRNVGEQVVAGRGSGPKASGDHARTRRMVRP